VKINKLLSAVVCLGLFFGCAHTTSDNVSEKTSYQSSSNSSREVASSSADIAKLYYDLAVTLSTARVNNHACESGVYEENVIEALERAREFDFDNFAIYELLKKDTEGNKIIKSQVGHTLAYKILTDKFMSFDGRTSISKLRGWLEGTRFSAPGQGAYGSTMNYSFKSGGVVVEKQLTDIDSWPFVWSESTGKWALNGYSQKHAGHRLSLTTKILTGPNKGKNKTKLFVIKRTCDFGSCMYGLIPINKVNEGNRYTPAFYDFKAFDLSTSECDA
jgi:hypothetical protein